MKGSDGMDLPLPEATRPVIALCEDHIPGSPQSSCELCLGPNRIRRRDLERQPDVLIQSTSRPICGIGMMWDPSRQSVASLPVTLGLVHLVGSWTDSDLRDVVRRCPDLHTIEAAVSAKARLMSWCDTLVPRGFGLQLINRYKMGM